MFDSFDLGYSPEDFFFDDDSIWGYTYDDMDLEDDYSSRQYHNDYYDEEELHIFGEGRLFYEVKPFDDIIKIVKDIKRLDLTKLDGLVEWFDDLLHKYQSYTGFSDIRINRLCILLNRQINKLKELQSLA